MGLTTLSAQLVSIFRAKLRRVVMKCKNAMFFNFRTRFLKISIFETAKFFAPSPYPID